jgi:DNA recombination protein RmuC
MGFRTLAIEKRSSDVWKVLGDVKTDFGRFGEALGKVRKKLDEAGSFIDQASTRTREIERKLRGVEELPPVEAQILIGEGEPQEETRR